MNNSPQLKILFFIKVRDKKSKNNHTNIYKYPYIGIFYFTGKNQIQNGQENIKYNYDEIIGFKIFY